MIRTMLTAACEKVSLFKNNAWLRCNGWKLYRYSKVSDRNDMLSVMCKNRKNQCLIISK